MKGKADVEDVAARNGKKPEIQVNGIIALHSKWEQGRVEEADLLLNRTIARHGGKNEQQWQCDATGGPGKRNIEDRSFCLTRLGFPKLNLLSVGRISQSPSSSIFLNKSETPTLSARVRKGNKYRFSNLQPFSCRYLGRHSTFRSEHLFDVFKKDDSLYCDRVVVRTTKDPFTALLEALRRRKSEVKKAERAKHKEMLAARAASELAAKILGSFKRPLTAVDLFFRHPGCGDLVPDGEPIRDMSRRSAEVQTSHSKTIRERSQPSAPKRSKSRPHQHHSAAPTRSSTASSWAWAAPAAAAATRTRCSSVPSRCWWPSRACRTWHWASKPEAAKLELSRWQQTLTALGGSPRSVQRLDSTVGVEQEQQQQHQQQQQQQHQRRQEQHLQQGTAAAAAASAAAAALHHFGTRGKRVHCGAVCAFAVVLMLPLTMPWNR